MILLWKLRSSTLETSPCQRKRSVSLIMARRTVRCNCLIVFAAVNTTYRADFSASSAVDTGLSINPTLILLCDGDAGDRTDWFAGTAADAPFFIDMVRHGFLLSRQGRFLSDWIKALLATFLSGFADPGIFSDIQIQPGDQCFKIIQMRAHRTVVAWLGDAG